MDKEDAMAVLRAAYSGEGLSEAELQRMLANSLAQDDSACGFAVEPKQDCPHAASLPSAGIDAARTGAGHLLGAGCEVCGDSSENWVCLNSGRLLCSRYVKGHMKQHADELVAKDEGSSGVVAISLTDLSAWCFQCDSYIAHREVEAVLDEVRKAKFGGGSSS